MSFFDIFDHHFGGNDFTADDHGNHYGDGHMIVHDDGSSHHGNVVCIDNNLMLHQINHDIAPNANELLGYDDPLIHAHNYHCNHLHLDHGYIVHGMIDNHHDLVHVNGYFKEDGTYVSPHVRTAPDGILENNLSYNK